mgnify:CR=1 FL=1
MKVAGSGCLILASSHDQEHQPERRHASVGACENHLAHLGVKPLQVTNSFVEDSLLNSGGLDGYEPDLF